MLRPRRVCYSSRHRGQIPLWLAVCLAIAFVFATALWTVHQTRDVVDGREAIIFWGNQQLLGDDIEAVIHRFEMENPKYRVIMSSSGSRDLTGDAQRLLTAVAGGVPPDVVYFDRFAIGEWAARGALADLRSRLAAQKPDDPDRMNLDDYFAFAIDEASYRTPGTDGPPGVYGIPFSTDVRFLYCNSDILRAGGYVEANGDPRPPRNWDELREYTNRLTIFRSAGDKNSGILRLGFAPNAGNAWLYFYAWQAGGEFLNSKPVIGTDARGIAKTFLPGTKVTLNTPANARALTFMTDLFDDVGGAGQVASFQEAQQGGALDPFVLNRVGMKIDGNWSLESIADWRPDMDFIVAPAPMPQDQLDLGKHPVAWSGGFALVIPATARQKDGAFKFIQFLRSWRAIEMLEQGKREQRQAEGKIYLPRIEVNKHFLDRLIKESIDGNPHLPPSFKRAYATIRELLPNTFIRPVTPIGQLLWNQHVRATDGATRHRFPDAETALRAMEGPAQEQLDKLLSPPPPNVVRWSPYLWIYAVMVALPILAIAMLYRVRRRTHGYRAREVGAAIFFASPWMIGFIALVGGPILFSIVLSFTRYDVLNEARYVGANNYAAILTDPIFYTSLFNTMYMVIAIPIGMAVSLAIALLLNRAVRGISAYRAAFYMPAIIPIVAASLMWVWLLNPTFGLVNTTLAWLYDTWLFDAIEQLVSRALGYSWHFTLPLWLQDSNWSKPSLILMKLWGAGGGMIIWLAGLQSIPNELYEAARVDGASAWQRFRNVTIPMLSPYILFNLIIGLIGTMKIFDESYIMTAGGPGDSTLFYAYYLFNQAFQYFNMGYASALAWILFLIVLLLTMVQLWLSTKWVHYEQA